MALPDGSTALSSAPRVANGDVRVARRVVRSASQPRAASARARWQQKHSRRLLVTDVAVVSCAIALAQWVRFGAATAASYHPVYVTTFSTLFALAWIAALALLHTRSPLILAAGAEEYRRVTAASFWTFGAIAIVTLLLKVDIARGYLAVALPAGTIGLLFSRWWWHRYLARQREAGQYQSTVLAFGPRDTVIDLAGELTRNPADGYRVVGLSMPGYGAGRGEHLVVNGRRIPVVGDETDLLGRAVSCGADTVAVTGTESLGPKGLRRLLWQLEPIGVDLVVSTGATDVALSRLAMQPIAGLPLLHIEKPLYRNAKRLQRSIFDKWFALSVLVVISPLMVIIALAIKLTSKGPVFYSSERIGIDGKPFQMLKFRTMVENADALLEGLMAANESDGLLFKIKDDPRVTAVGRVLRRFSIDELPQFLNVLRGEMSVVGPRPPLRREVEGYDAEVLRRLLVKPGITGLWQVSGRSDLSWSDGVRLDLSYVDNWSFIGDLIIAAKTLRAVVRCSGAY